MSIGDLGPLLPLLLHQGLGRGQGEGSGPSDDAECLPGSFQDYLASLVGERIKIYVGFQTLVPAPPAHTEFLIARLVAVDGDYLVLEDISVNGTPVVDPRRLAYAISNIEAVERLTERQILLETLLDVD
jgi:hypothetical protein